MAIAGTLGLGCAPILLFGVAGAAFALLSTWLLIYFLLAAALAGLFFLLLRALGGGFAFSCGLVLAASAIAQLVIVSRYTSDADRELKNLAVVMSLVPLFLVLRWLDKAVARRNLRGGRQP